MTALSPMTDLLLEEAASWRIRLHELGVPTTAEFETWRHSSPEHEAAWARVEVPWRYLGEQATAPELIAARGAALERARRAGKARFRNRNSWSQRRRVIFATVATAAAGSVAVVGTWLYLNQPVTYRTGIAERRVVALTDGSTVSLDSDSKVRVHFTQQARELILVRGQGRFDVAHDVQRPFSVDAGDRRVVATGTSFDVDLLGPEVAVTLIEGHVVVLDRESSGPTGADARTGVGAVKLEPGERLVAVRHASASVQRVNLEKATAWQSGYLIFEDETLGAAVLRINRYARKPVFVRDSSAATLRFSGVFKEGETSAFLDSVTRYLPVDEQKREDGSIELRRRD